MLRSRLLQFLFDPNEATPAAPWAEDAATYFGENAEAAAAFDRYMREKQQPYVTQLETSYAPAKELWTDLNDETKVEGTVRDIVASVYADAPDVLSAFDAIFAETTPPVVESAVTTPPVVDEPPEWARPLVEDFRTRTDRELAKQQADDYAEFKTGLKESHGLTDDDLGLIDPFIAVSAHDVDAAVASYKAFAAKFAPPADPPPVVDPPPPVVDGAVVPPIATKYTKYDQIGAALRAHLSQQSVGSTPPPVVG